MKMVSKTQQALELFAQGKTKYEAALAVGLTPTAVYAAVARQAARADKPRCPACDHAILVNHPVTDIVQIERDVIINAIEQSPSATLVQVANFIRNRK